MNINRVVPLCNYIKNYYHRHIFPRDFISEKIQREKIEQLTAAKIINIFPSFIEELLS